MTSMSPAEIRMLPLSALVFSQTPMQVERRKMRTAEEIRERAESIRQVGVLQPILVRPMDVSTDSNGNWDKWEVVYGEGRILSAREAGLEEIPAIVRELTDEQVEDIQLIENLQRDDVHELVEARGYETLLKHGHSVEEIAQRVGKSKRTIYTRLQLLKLDPATEEAFRSGRIDFSKALLIARLPQAVDQRKAGAEIADMTYQRAREYIECEYMLRLADAPFDTSDATLLKNTPACGPCPKRTGNQPELFEDVKSADICTDKRCFRAKCEAAAKLKLALARKNGQQIITGQEARRILPHSYTSYMHGDYARPDDQCWDDPKHRTYRQILGRDYMPLLLQNPHDKGQVLEVVRRSDALKKLRTDGVLKPEKKRKTTVNQASQQYQPGQEQQLERRLLDAVRAKDGGKLTSELLRYLVAILLESAPAYDSDLIKEEIGFVPRVFYADTVKRLEKMSDAKITRAIVDALYLYDLEFNGGDLLRRTAKRLKIDEEKIREQTETELAAKRKAPAKAAKKKGGKK